MRFGEKNDAFFNQHHTVNPGHGVGVIMPGSHSSIAALLRASRSSGALSLTNRNMSEIPSTIFSTSPEEGEKFWEFVPLSKLDLSFNQLLSLPVQVSQLEGLQILKMRSNALKSISDSLFDGCRLLRVLDLSHNSLSALSPAVGQLEQLTELLLQENNIRVLPPHLEACKLLQVLNLHQNRLMELPSMRLPQLLVLDVGQNELSMVPQQLIQGAPLLETLICCKNRLHVLPDLTILGRLTHLDARENQLTDFPLVPAPSAQPKKATAVSAAGTGGGVLSVVNLGYNNIASISIASLHAILQQQNIAELHLPNNKLKALNAELHQLSRLKVLDVSNNDLSDIPYELGYIETLQLLSLDGNPLRSIRRNLITRAATGDHSGANVTQDLKKFLRSRGDTPTFFVDYGGKGSSKSVITAPTSMTVLDYRVRDIAEGGVLNLAKLSFGREVPVELYDKLFQSHTLQSLTRVDVSGNALERPPSELACVRTLQALTLNNNRLNVGLRLACENAAYTGTSWIPSSLRVIDISSNGLTTEDAEAFLSQAHQLTSVNLSRNVILTIPKSIHCLIGLRELLLAFNQIAHLPLDFNKLPHLEILDVSNNKLRELGVPVVSSYRSCSLRIINFANNDLNDIPYQYGFIETLQSLSLQGNSIKTLRQQIINGPFDTLKQALRNKAPIGYDK